MQVKREPKWGKLTDPRVRVALYYARKKRLARIKAQKEAAPPDP